MEQASRRALHYALIDQACHAQTCLSYSTQWTKRWTKLLPPEFKDTLDDFVARLLKVNAKLITASDMVRRVFYPLEESDKNSSDLCLLCDWATSELQSMYLLFKPLYALNYSLFDSRRTGRSKDHRVLVDIGNDFKAQEIGPFKFGGRKILVDVIDAYEASITRVLSRIQEVAENQSDISSLFQRRPVSLLFKGVEFHGRPDIKYRVRVTALAPPKGSSFVKVTDVQCLTSQIVVDSWSCSIPGHLGLLRLPNLLNLRHRYIESGTFADFTLRDWTLTELNQVIRVITHLVAARRQFLHSLESKNNHQVDSIGDDETEAGLLLLQDEMGVRIGVTNTDRQRKEVGVARMKHRQVKLYQNFLVIGRWNGLSLIIVHKVPVSDLLQVNFEPGNIERSFGRLLVFWKDESGEGTNCALLWLSGPATLTIWAAFLASAASKLPVAGLSEVPNVPSISVFDFPYLEHVRELQQLLGLLPLIKSKELDPYNGISMNLHLIKLGRRLSQLRSEMPPLQRPRQCKGGAKSRAVPEEEGIVHMTDSSMTMHLGSMLRIGQNGI